MYWSELHISKKSDTTQTFILDFENDGLAHAVGDYIITCQDDNKYVFNSDCWNKDVQAIQNFIKYFGHGSKYVCRGVFNESKFCFASEPQMYEDDINEFLE